MSTADLEADQPYILNERGEVGQSQRQRRPGATAVSTMSGLPHPKCLPFPPAPTPGQGGCCGSREVHTADTAVAPAEGAGAEAEGLQRLLHRAELAEQRAELLERLVRAESQAKEAERQAREIAERAWEDARRHGDELRARLSALEEKLRPAPGQG